MIIEFLAAAGAAGCMFGLGWWAGGLHWERGGREVERLLDEAQAGADLRALPKVPPHAPSTRPARAQHAPSTRPARAQHADMPGRVVVVATRHPVLWGDPAGTPIFDQLSAEFERRVHPADEQLATALAAGAAFAAGLDSWADGARALVRGEG